MKNCNAFKSVMFLSRFKTKFDVWLQWFDWRCLTRYSLSIRWYWFLITSCMINQRSAHVFENWISMEIDLIPWKIFHTLSWFIETVRIRLMLPRWMLVSYWLEVHLQKVVFSSFHAQLIYFVPVVDEFNTWWKPNKESLSKFDLH